MGVDKSYGSGKSRSAANSASRANAARAASSRRTTIKKAGRKIGNAATAKLSQLPGTSQYIVGENAARAQLGVSGQAARYRQLPTAARATARGAVREITGIDISRKGVSVDPTAIAMALPVGKLLKAAKIARAAGQIDTALALEGRIAAKALGGSAKAKGMYPGKAFLGETGLKAGTRARQSSEYLFPRLPKKGPMGQPDLGDLSGRGVGLPWNTPAQIRRANRARLKGLGQGTPVTELEKRLNLPGTAPKRRGR